MANGPNIHADGLVKHITSLEEGGFRYDCREAVKYLINGFQDEFTVNGSNGPTVSAEQTLQQLNRYNFTWPVIHEE